MGMFRIEYLGYMLFCLTLECVFIYRSSNGNTEHVFVFTDVLTITIATIMQKILNLGH